MDLDDKILHYLLVGAGLALGTLLRTGVEALASIFWKKELKEK